MSPDQIGFSAIRSQDLVAKFSSELAGEVAADAQRKHPQPKVDSYPCRYIDVSIANIVVIDI